MNELSLFTGAGGGLLGTHLLGWRPVGYVEFNDYCQRVIAARIRDGILPDAPIFGDVRAFISDGYAAAYTGLVDVLTGGFPCQPFSVAGKRDGADDERNMWPSTIECIRIVRPRYAFLENVPGILSSGYFGRILGDLAESGYDCRWRILSAAELGAPHKRDRLWIVTHARSAGAGLDSRRASGDCRQIREPTDAPQPTMVRQEHRTVGTEGYYSGCADVAHPDDSNGDGRRSTMQVGREWQPGSTKENCHTRRIQWGAESGFRRVAHGVASRLERLNAAGNAQVPAVAAAAWHLLTEGLNV